MKKFTLDEIENFATNGSQKSWLKKYYNFIEERDLWNLSENQIINQMGLKIDNKNTQQAMKSTFLKFVNQGLQNSNTQNSSVNQNFDDSQTSDSNLTSAELAEQLRQKEELAKIQAENLAKTQREAQQEKIRLEQLRIQEAKRKAEEEARRKEEARKQRIEARTAGFESEEIPDYFTKFDYIGNIPTESKDYYQQEDEEDLLTINLRMGKHTILTGSAGSGKSELSIKKAKELKRPIFKFSCSSDVRMSDLIGSKTIDEKGNIKFEAGMLLKAVLTANKYGSAILLLDEINVLSEKVQKNINGLADSTGFIDLPIGKIRVNKGVQFVIVGTCNLSYAGTNPLNPEFKDRFDVIQMPKLTKETKHKIYAKYQPSQEIEELLISISNELEELQKNNDIAGDVEFSTRSQLAFLEKLEEYEAEQIPNAINKALNLSLVNKFDDPEHRQIVKKMVERLI